MPRVPLRRDGQDNRRREGDPVCGSPSLHRCLRMRAGIFSHKDLPQGRRGARPAGKREGGRKGAGGPEPLRMHSQKNPVKTECANIIVRFRKNETRKNHTRIPDDDGKNRLCEKPVFPIARHVPHPGSKPREIGGGFVWRRKYAAAIDRRTDCRGGASPHSSRAAHIERKKGNAYGNTHSLVCAESGKTTENRGIPPPANAAETAPESGRTFGRPLYGPAVLAGSMRCPSECPPSPKSEPRRQGAGRAFGDRFRRTQTRTRTVRQYCRSFRNGYAGRTGRLSDWRLERLTLARNSPVRLLL